MTTNDLLFRATFEQAAIGLAHVDLEGTWLDANHHLCDMLGYAPRELRSRSFREITHPDDLAAGEACLRRLLSEDVRVCSLQKRYLRRDRTPVWTELTVSLVRDADGSPRSFLKIVRPLAHGASTAAPPERSGKSIDDIALELEGTVQDLNALLIVVLSCAELATSCLPHASPALKDLSEIRRAALQASELTSHLLTLRQR